jgi:hypothetical protein
MLRKARAPVVVGVLLVAGLGAVAVLTNRPSEPASAERLRLRVAPGSVIPSLGCPAALVSPIRFGHDGDRATFTVVATGQKLPFVWPAGWSAWIEKGSAVLRASEGFVYAREGDVLDDVVGGADPDGSIPVCFSMANPAKPRDARVQS